jgi:FMN phosphatase YigB (HAD superfamily)
MTETTQHNNSSAERIVIGKSGITIPLAEEIRAIVFDLDGTLYVSEEFATAIQGWATVYLSGVLEVSVDEARQTMAATRRRLTEERGAVQTLSAVCCSLGGSMPDIHAFFQKHLTPESFLMRDNRVVALLKRLRQQFALYVYTNNSRFLVERISNILGIDGCFNGIFSIDDTWRAKPDEERLGQILKIIGLPACEVLFVGDRYEVDLRLPEQKGCPVFLSTNIDQLLRLDQLAGSEGT